MCFLVEACTLNKLFYVYNNNVFIINVIQRQHQCHLTVVMMSSHFIKVLKDQRGLLVSPVNETNMIITFHMTVKKSRGRKPYRSSFNDSTRTSQNTSGLKRKQPA